MKIYVVTSGTYSDYHIIAPTINKSKAERIKNIFSGPYGNDASVEVFEDGDGEDIRILWQCDEHGRNAEPVDEQDKNNPFCPYNVEDYKVLKDGMDRIYGILVYAKDAEHAEKKAQDMIAEYKYRKQVEESGD